MDSGRFGTRLEDSLSVAPWKRLSREEAKESRDAVVLTNEICRIRTIIRRDLLPKAGREPGRD